MKNKLFKFSLLTFALIFSFSQLNAQQKENDKNIRSISVTGKAEKEIAPDIIYFTISLKEYAIKSGSKFTISELENQLSSAVKKAGIDKENLTVENVYGYNYNWQKKEENKDFMARKQYRLKLSDGKYLHQILNQLDPKGIEYVRVTEYTHSRIQEINQELQVEAVKNAKAKAEALLKPLGEELGKVIEIQENAGGYQPVYYYKNQNNNMRSMSMAEESGMDASDVEFRNIKLEVELNIVFSIK
ncbi:SIMPL domain-containing protein [Marivirga sp. S37H4]|uniref:SIMPL domain-containing protein n=1 Tax=Marivirga aurantiaca TaxID=2802615 RepID=A0A934WZ68_9BACT|nr:SIMPL domain-containing protein [Marivirga aurantiaca]MBK6265486.1 SIMPL domain-containing protein [Marivirga aurantiaca]